MQFLDALERRRRGTKNADRILTQTADKAAHRTRLACSTLLVSIRHQNSRQCRERGIEHCLSISGLSGIELFEPLSTCQLKRVMVRKEALDQHFTGAIAAARSAGNLRQQLEGSL